MSVYIIFYIFFMNELNMIFILQENSNNIPAILNKVDVPIVSDAACKVSYGSSAIKSGMMCAGYLQGLLHYSFNSRKIQ